MSNSSQGMHNLGILQEKTKKMNKIKEIFFQKMKNNLNNPAEAQRYYSYLRRAISVSALAYNRLAENLKRVDLNSMDNSFDVEANEELKRVCGNELFIEDAKMLSSMAKLNYEFRKVIESLLSGNPGLLSELLEIVQKEKDEVEKLDNVNFFQGTYLLSDLEKLMQKELKLGKILVKVIVNFESKVVRFTAKMKLNLKKFNRFLAKVERSLSEGARHPVTNAIIIASLPMKLGVFLEHHASAFALTILTLSIASGLFATAGLSAISLVSREIMIILAEYGEGTQALPAVTEGYKRFRARINSTLRVANTQAVTT